MIQISRRTLLAAGGAVALSPLLWTQPAQAGAPIPEQVHLTMGEDGAREMTVSWVVPAAVSRPRVVLGTPHGGVGYVVAADLRSYTDHTTGLEVRSCHARLTGLEPATDYVYAIWHDGLTEPFRSAFRTGPAGRTAFRFTSFGDQGSNEMGAQGGGNLGTPYSDYIIGQVERAAPVVNLVNGDLAYSDLAQSPVAAWAAWFRANQLSTANRPWMPALGNHENETGNGPQGFASYLSRYALPPNGSARFQGNWYAFTVGAVRFISLDNNDAAYQDAGNFYIRDYSGSEQRRWLERELHAARRDAEVDWVVVFMHHAFISSSGGNGCDLGVREQWGELFDTYDVDLVLAGHEHDYERSFLLKGHDPTSATRTPLVASSETAAMDATQGAVHMVLGGGGSLPTNEFMGVTQPVLLAQVNIGKARTAKATEVASWSAVRDTEFPYGFATFDVDPGPVGGRTTITVTYYRTGVGANAAPLTFESFTLSRPRGPHAAGSVARVERPHANHQGAGASAPDRGTGPKAPAGGRSTLATTGGSPALAFTAATTIATAAAFARSGINDHGAGGPGKSETLS